MCYSEYFVFISASYYGVFTLPNTESETETDKKMGCIELCGDVHTAQRQTLTEIPIGFFGNFSVSMSVSIYVSVSISGSVKGLHKLWQTAIVTQVHLNLSYPNKALILDTNKNITMFL